MRTSFASLCVVLLGSIACSKSDSGAKPEAAAPKAPPTEAVPSAPPVAKPAAPGGSFDAATLCDSPCLLLASHPYDAVVSGEACRSCANPTACASSLEDDSCAKADELRNCIYAAYGYPFKKPRWQKEFGKQPWYKPNRAFTDSMLSKIAAANIAKLKPLGCKAARANTEWGPLATPLNDKGGWTLKADLDGDGKPETINAEKEWLRVGTSEIKTELTNDDYKYGNLELVDLEKADKGQEIGIIHQTDEDYWTMDLYRYSGGKVTAVGSIGSGSPYLEFPGDGTIHKKTEHCGVNGHYIYRFDGGDLKEVKRTETGTPDKDCEESACPHVFVERADGRFRYVGEILRDLVGSQARATQPLTLSASDVHGGKLVVRVAERESETTHLDAIYVTVDGARVAPTACAGAASAACDGRAVRLEYGDELVLEFPVGEVPASAEIILWGTGYYELQPVSHGLR